MTPKTTEEFYDIAASAPTGGMYPVGANGLWHGGVHLSLGEEPPIRAPAGGRIVAARLDPDPDRATCAFGDTNFILTRHSWPPSAGGVSATEEDGTPYYMLFMHLAPRPLEAVAQEAGVAPWLTGEPLLRVTAETGLNVRLQPRPGGTREGGVPHGALLKPRGEPTGRAGYRWQEVGVLDQDLEGYVALGPLKEGALQEQWTEEAPPPGGRDLVGTLKGGGVAKLDVPIEAGEMLWWGGEYGQEFEWDEEFEAVMDDAIANTMEMMGEGFEHPEPIERAPSIHWEVFSGEKAFGAEDGGAGASDNASKNGSAGGSGSGDKGGGNEKAGGPSLQMPSWKTKVAGPSTRTVNPEDSEALALIEKTRSEAPALPDAPTAYRSCTLGEKKSVHFLEAGEALRRYAVKNVSEWAIEDLDRAVKKSPGRQASEKKDLKALQWWKKAKKAGVELPDSRKVWHYHPVTVLKAIAAQKPQFFVNVGGEQKEVTTYEDIRDLVFEKHGVPESIGGIEALYESANQNDVPSYTTVVERGLDGTDVTVKRPESTSSEDFASVEAGHIKDKHGNITGWKAGVYDFASGTPDLYEMLIEEKKMRPGEPKKGGPDLPDFDANVWAALSESEACLKGINTWDRALVTIGPIQQTLGVGGAKGELQGALHTAWLGAPEAYKRRLGRHGLQILDQTAEPVQGAKKAHASLHGEPLRSEAKKAELQRFEWVDRLAEAFGDPKLRYWMLREGFKRLERIRTREMTLSVGGKTIDTTIGELFRRDLSQALLLDWHINSPADVWSQSTDDNSWLIPIQNRFETWGITAVSQLRKSQDLQLTASLLQARVGNMTDPVGRAIGILKYTENEAVENLATVNQPTGTQTVPDFLNRVLDLNDSDRSARDAWNGIQSHGRKTLSLDLL